MNAPLSRYLAHFSAMPLIEPMAECLGDDLVLVVPPPPEPEVTLTVGALDARLQDARRNALAEAETAHAATLAEMETRHADALAAAVAATRTERTDAEAAALATQVDGAFAALHERLAEALAKVLRPLTGDAVRARTLDSLTTALGRLTEDGARAITLRVPADLVTALRIRGVPTGVALVAADVGEAEATLDGTRIETRLAAALADLAEA